MDIGCNVVLYCRTENIDTVIDDDTENIIESNVSIFIIFFNLKDFFPWWK